MPDNTDPVLQTTIEVTIDGCTFIFAIPSFKDEIKLGLRARQIRRDLEFELLPNKQDPQALATVAGDPTFDQQTETYVRTATYFEVLLRSSSVQWIYTPDDNGKPVVDYTKWPDAQFNTIVRAGVDFSNQLTRFRQGGTTSPNTYRNKTVDREQDTESEPVQSGTPESQ